VIRMAWYGRQRACALPEACSVLCSLVYTVRTLCLPWAGPLAVTAERITEGRTRNGYIGGLKLTFSARTSRALYRIMMLQWGRTRAHFTAAPSSSAESFSPSQAGGAGTYISRISQSLFLAFLPSQAAIHAATTNSLRKN
jgi:hypothetical protein